MKKRLISIFLIVSIIISVFAVSAVSTSVGAASQFSVSKPMITGISNEGPMGRKIYWNYVPGATWYRVYKLTENGEWKSVSKANTKQNWIYDTYPNNNGDTYVLRCVKSSTGNNYASECSDRLSVYPNKRVCNNGYAPWLVGKTIKVSASKSAYTKRSDNNRSGNAKDKVFLYKDVNCTKSLQEIKMDGKNNLLTVKGVGYKDGDTNAKKTVIKATTPDNVTGYVKMNYVLVNVKQYIPAVKVALSLANKRAYNWHIASVNYNKNKLSGNYNMFNYNGIYKNTTIIPNLNDTIYYGNNIKGTSPNVAYLRYDVVVELLKAQRDMFRRDYPWQIKIYDAYRPNDVSGAISTAWRKYVDTLNVDDTTKTLLKNQVADASYVSTHNTGRAVDMSIIDARTGVEYDMPTYMHDLSLNSAQGNWFNKSGTGNQDATYMYRFMTDRGWAAFPNEWWHFQVENIDPSDLVVYAANNSY